MIRRVMILGSVLALAGCGKDTPAPAEPVRIAAASDLQSVMPRIIERFTAATGVEVVATFGPSGQLAQQIKQGAPFDVFLAANRKYVSDLAGEKAIDPLTVRDYAVGVLVLAVHADVADKVNGLDDLKNASVHKVAIANPDVAPYGAAAKQILTRSGLWDELEPKRVQSESVSQALDFVRTGNAEVAFVGSAIAAAAKGIKAVPIPQEKYDPMWQALGVTTNSMRYDDAQAFCRFVLEGDGRKTLIEAGFHVPSEFR